VSVVSVVSVVRGGFIGQIQPPVQMLNTTETRDTTCCTRKNEFYLSYEFFSFGGRGGCGGCGDMETRLKFKATVSCPSMQQISQCGNLKFISAYRRSMNELSTIKNVSPCRNRLVQMKLSSSHFQAKGTRKGTLRTIRLKYLSHSDHNRKLHAQ